VKSFLTRKRTIVLGGVAVLAVTATAIAYWTTNGSGTGSATTGTSSAVTVTQVGSISGLYPGGPAQAIDFKIGNGSGQNQYIASVAVSISSVVPGGPPGSCTAADFTVTQPTVVPGDLTPGVHTYSPSGATLKLDNTASNQDGCKNATVNLAFNAS
jgi:hypothetical protein